MQNVRLRGLLKLVAGAAGFSAVFWFILNFGAEPDFGGVRGRGGIAIVAGLPGAFALVGLIELCTGVRFTDLADYWDSLKAWQRGIFGTLVVITAFAVTFGVTVGLAFLKII